MRKLFVFLGIVFLTIGSALRAQEVDSIAPLQKSSWGDAKESEIAEYIPDISLDTRFGYLQNISGKSGRFNGNGLFLDVNGKIGKHFSYSLNHRLASFEGDDIIGFDNTNWLLLTFETEHFSISAGKDALYVGSFEYETYDLDSYAEMNSTFWQEISCWQFGLSAAWYPAEDQSLSFQFANSPFSSVDFGNLFSYALAWRGAWDCYESYWTANLWQSGAKSYVSALNLGNRFYFGDFTLDLEYMTRGNKLKELFTKDFTILASPSYEWEWGRAFAKCGWESIKINTFDYGLAAGESISNLFYGAGVEFFPLKKYKGIRLHAAWSSSYGEHFLDLGVTCKFNLTEAGKHLAKKLKK